jgi:predicted DNA-binding antitoxin AbrB/MazE fold protein
MNVAKVLKPYLKVSMERGNNKRIEVFRVSNSAPKVKTSTKKIVDINFQPK